MLLVRSLPHLALVCACVQVDRWVLSLVDSQRGESVGVVVESVAGEAAGTVSPTGPPTAAPPSLSPSVSPTPSPDAAVKADK